MRKELGTSRRILKKPAEAATADLETVSVDEAAILHDGQWILMKVTELDDNRLPFKGIVVAHDRSRAKIAERHIAEITPEREAGARYYVFEGVPYVRTGAQLQEAIKAARRAGVTDAWRRW